MPIVRATVFCLAALLIASGCRDSGSDSPKMAAEQNPGDTETVWLLDKIRRPDGPPKSPEELARHIQYAIQEQDKMMLAALFYRIESEGYKVQAEKIDSSIDSLLGARKQNLTCIVAVALNADEIRKLHRLAAQAVGKSATAILTPDVTHAIRFEYHGRVETGTTRPTSIGAGQHADVCYIATLQVGVAESDEE